MALPEGAVWWHTPLGGARSRTEAAILKGLGTRPGLPDIMVLFRARLIAIELKAPGGRLSAAQADMHRRLPLAGAVVFTAYSLDELADFLGEIVPLRARVA